VLRYVDSCTVLTTVSLNAALLILRFIQTLLILIVQTVDSIKHDRSCVDKLDWGCLKS